MKQQQQVQDSLLFPFSSMGSTRSAYFPEPKWSVMWCVDLTWFINPHNEGLYNMCVYTHNRVFQCAVLSTEYSDFYVSCIVHWDIITQHEPMKHTFQINILIQFFLFWCLLHVLNHPENEPLRFKTCIRHQKLKNWIKVLIWRVCILLVYVVCPKSKCTDFLFNYLLDFPEITSYLLRNMTLGKLHSSSNVSSTDHSSTGSHFP